MSSIRHNLLNHFLFFFLYMHSLVVFRSGTNLMFLVLLGFLLFLILLVLLLSGSGSRRRLRRSIVT